MHLNVHNQTACHASRAHTHTYVHFYTYIIIICTMRNEMKREKIEEKKIRTLKSIYTQCRHMDIDAYINDRIRCKQKRKKIEEKYRRREVQPRIVVRETKEEMQSICGNNTT